MENPIEMDDLGVSRECLAIVEPPDAVCEWTQRYAVTTWIAREILKTLPETNSKSTWEWMVGRPQQTLVNPI